MQSVISSQGHGVNSVKAFKRYVNKKCHHMKNHEITLVSRYYFTEKSSGKEFGISVTAKWQD